MQVRLLIMSTIAVLGTALMFEATAAACGGCLSAPGTFTAVDSHRMVIKLGIDETILWDQFIYSGAPQEFVWVLPIPTQDAVIEIADAAFIDVMDEETTPLVSPPSATPCASDPTSGGCGGSGGFGGPGPVDGVEVVQRGVVGPYETVVLDSKDPAALYTWLAINGYAFPDSGQDTLDHYTTQGSSFVILRLRPGVDVSAMQPVRVRFKGFMGRFPLRMVTMGAVGQLELSLWIVAEQRYAPANYANAVVDEGDLVWDWQTSTANYDDVFDATILDAGGRAWITEYAAPLDNSDLKARLAHKVPTEHAIVAATPSLYVTRLRTKMFVDYLNEDLWIGPAADASDRRRELVAGQSINVDCSAAAVGFASIQGGGAQTVLLIAMAMLILWVRRR